MTRTFGVANPNNDGYNKHGDDKTFFGFFSGCRIRLTLCVSFRRYIKLTNEKSDGTESRRFRSETTHHSNRRYKMKEKTITALRCMLDQTKNDPIFFLVCGIAMAVILKIAWV